MTNVDQAKASQFRNIEAKTGQSLEALCAEINGSGKVKHGEIRTWLMERFGLGYGDANALAHAAKSEPAKPEDTEDPLAQIYFGTKEHLRSIHDALITAVTSWGEFEQSPKKAWVALRRKKQFAMLGPKNAQSAELGINLKDEIKSSRILPQKPGGMCQYAIAISDADEIDAELLAVLRRAFDAAG